jgi:ABC-2 type transport system ATP-binding protein
MISVKNVSKSFGDLDALQKVNLNVNKGSIYGLVGSNGAGKTTLLKLLAGIYKQDGGEVQIAGENVFENIKIKSETVFIPDSLYFFSLYTIDNMASYYKNIYPNWNNERYKKLIKIFNIDVNKKINSLSKGIQRQVAFCLALSTMPKVMLLDEPLDGLDPVMRQKVKNLIIQDVADKKMTILISSHNLRELEDICDHIGILHKGNLIVEKDLDELKADVHKIQIAFKDKVPEELLNNAHILHKEERGNLLLLILKGNKSDVINHFNKFNPVILDIIPLTLEEIFIYEMGDVDYELQNIML